LQTPIQLLVDSSHTALTGRNTGIERVVRSLIEHFPNAVKSYGDSKIGRSPTAASEMRPYENPAASEMRPYDVQVIHIDDAFYTVDRELEESLARSRQFEAHAVQCLPSFLSNFLRFGCRLPGVKGLRDTLLPKPSHLGIYKGPFHFHLQQVLQRRRRRSGPVQATSNTILLLPDAYWGKRRVWPAVADARSKGATICSLVYDLIPITHPQFVGPKRSEKVRGYFDALLHHSDLVVTISQTVANELRRYVAETYDESSPICRDIRPFSLGAYFRIANGPVRDKVKELFCSRERSPFIIVGSFDARKNHQQVLDAFDLLWKKSSSLQLCLIGRSGSHKSPLAQKIESHKEFGNRLFWFPDLSDLELQRAYQNTRGVIMPSIVEGFGLPIIESLWFGAPTLASDISIHREVGGDHCEYFPLGDVPTLTMRIEEMGHRSPNMHTKSRFVPTTWDQSAQELLQLCVEAHFKKQGRIDLQAVAA
jgi:glycosyltransferase involved in cell wall biosynthesis